MKKVAIIMGSDSDLPVVTPAIKQLRELDLNEDEKMAMEETVAIKRQEDPFWGM